MYVIQAAGRTETIIELNGEGNQPGGECDANGTEPLVPPLQEGLHEVASTGGKYDMGVTGGQVFSTVVVNNKGQDGKPSAEKDSARVARRKELTPTAPAWTPSGPVDTDTADEQQSAGEDSSIAVPLESAGLTEADDTRQPAEVPVAHESSIKPPENESRNDKASPGNGSVVDGSAPATTSELSA